MILPIYLYDHPVLRQVAEPIADITPEVRRLAQDMLETMYNAHGIGLAANQVGVARQLIVVDIGKDEGMKEPLVLLNPTIEATSEETSEMEEGCLSLPELRDAVIRPAAVQVRYIDLQGREHRITADGLLARVLQHEMDHLNGVYFVDRLSLVRRTLLRRKLDRIARGEVLPPYPVVLGHATVAQRSEI
ncbi:MAG: peptide deformylase [Candidatus Kapabacteria bacterium]|nr:peptide deformylase [Candidatus Kapabacteria bacterium]MDW8011396.1 peptide deformylase [Bacteroidota bacterium]